MNRYPDMGCVDLYDALAAKLRRRGRSSSPRAPAASRCSTTCCRPTASPATRSCYAWRSFEAYPIAVAVPVPLSVQVPLTADGRHDLDAMAAAITDRTKVVVLCTPNNPTGPALGDAEVSEVPRPGAR